MRSTYWTCTKFADWLRGTPKPGAATSKGWADWKKEARARHPFRYWLTEEVLDKVQEIINWPAERLNDVRYYINNRFISRSHALTAHPDHVKPGKWCDLTNRYLYCMFNELKDFVEIETAWHHVVWDEEARKKYAVPWWRKNFFRWRTWRCPEAGIAHLEWAASLTNGTEPTSQAIGAQEILDLYYWWTEEYPNRPDIHDITGWSDYCERKRQENPDEIMPEDNTPEERKSTSMMLDEMQKIEAQYEQEDEQMMIRLIKIRQHLWT